MKHPIWLPIILCLISICTAVAADAEVKQKRLIQDAETGLLKRLNSNAYPSIDAVLVMEQGDLIFQHYRNGHWSDRLHQLRSVTKAIGAILVGIAMEHGKIPDPDANLPGTDHPVSWRHVLTMSGGFDCDDLTPSRACLNPFYRSLNWLGYMQDMEITDPPGQNWSYNSGSLILLSHGLEQVTGEDLDQWAETHLFGPMGISPVLWRHSPEGIPWLGGGLRMTPPDLAKIGQLVLQKGKWKGRQLLSADWVRDMTSSQLPTNLDRDYGYLWWSAALRQSDQCHPVQLAAGGGGQRLYIIPKMELVVVLMGHNYKGEFEDPSQEILIQWILPMIPGHFELDNLQLTAPCKR